jgi:DNA-binding HxlR family transcriptional regulator
METFDLSIGWITFRITEKQISGISNKMFTQTVRELEKDGLISRKFFRGPPKVEYKLRREEDR